MAGEDFVEPFLEDYFAECEEHLATLRRGLLALEERAGRAPAEPATLNEVFRSLHTLKGLSGMVGLTSAERVAHAMEEGLRAAGAGAAVLDAAAVDALFAGTRLLERCIAARRAGGEPPEVQVFLAELDATLHPVGAHAAGEAGEAEHPAAAAALPVPGVDPARLAAARREGASVLRFEFTPSAELAARGVNVEVVRARLAGLGEVLAARPRVAEGGIAFDFVVAVPPGAAPDEAWHADRLSWTAYDPDAAAAEPARPGPAPTAADPGDVSAARARPLPGAASPAAPSSVVRVDLARLDDLMRVVGELVVNRGRLENAIDRLEAGERDGALEALREANGTLERQLRELREGVMRVRLVPVGEAFERMRFVAREVARELGKRVSLEVRGEGTELDKLVVERMMEPLLHLVRNAVSHGIEAPAVRRERGKPEEGHLALRAHASGDRITIVVEDDGAGIDAERVAVRARERGLLGADERLGADALLDVLCAPGFSTRDAADLASGRGVGMAVVRATVRELGGELSLWTAPGRGTRFTVVLPLTLMIVDALLVEVAGQPLAVPQPGLREIIRLEPSAVTGFERNEVVAYRGQVLPLLSLRRLFSLPDAEPGRALNVLVVGGESDPVGLVVDRLLGLHEIVVHPLTDPLVAVPGVGGATELADGRVSLILDAPALVRLARERRERASALAAGARGRGA